MAKLIEFKHIYENKVCTDITKLLIFIKNILANCKKERLFHYPEGYLIPIRWSAIKNKLVIDLGTDLNRDLNGIDLDNTNYYFSNKPEYLEILNQLLSRISNDNLGDYYNIKKNQSKFIAIIYCLNTEKYYNLGLYSFTRTNKRKGVYHSNKKSILIDSSKEFKNNINNFYNVLNPSKSYFIKTYTSLYYDFIKHLKSKDYIFNLNNKSINISLQSLIENNLKFDYSLSHKRNKEIIENKKILPKEENIFKNNIVKYIVSIEFYNFLVENKIIDDYVYFYDDKTKLNYKIKDLKSLDYNNFNIEKSSKVEYNPYMLLPLKV
tara:strand:+ start:116 stop:1078 length:963 start_codon:yes stop_codon:yes gene_type:complete